MPLPEAVGSDAEPIAADRLRGSELCTQCGLCCTGAIHDKALLEPDEVEDARSLGLPVLTGAVAPGFALPCPRLNGTVCSIYRERPSVCARYKCQLLQYLECGQITFDNASAQVWAALDLAAQVKARMAADMTVPRARVESVQPVPTSPNERSASVMLRLANASLNLYLDKHFRTGKDRRMFLSIDAAGDSNA